MLPFLFIIAGVLFVLYGGVATPSEASGWARRPTCSCWFPGFFLPPILLPIIIQAGFDPCWFAVVLTVNMEIGLITPPAVPAV